MPDMRNNPQGATMKTAAVLAALVFAAALVAVVLWGAINTGASWAYKRQDQIRKRECLKREQEMRDEARVRFRKLLIDEYGEEWVKKNLEEILVQKCITNWPVVSELKDAVAFKRVCSKYDNVYTIFQLTEESKKLVEKMKPMEHKEER
jgi:hypothetical protein